MIDKTTTAEDIEQMADFMKQNGYCLSIIKVGYSKQGFVRSISGEVDFGNSSGTFNSEDIARASVVIEKSLVGRLNIQLKKSGQKD